MGKDIQNQSLNKWRLVQFAMEFGFTIALPLVALGLAGKWLDRKADSDPWFTLAGILLAIAMTTIWITRRIKELMKR
ncbi:MAG: AtpZ/AtpI family protein [Candidatus Doudnabacteria bacterium]|nr:AtpZ/AtpI family protein [Candidatus Doudnabacteria bacterium]